MSRHVEFRRLHNFRDLGGYLTGDGRIVGWGRLFRSDSLVKLRDEDWDRFLELRVRAVIDLRPAGVPLHVGQGPDAEVTRVRARPGRRRAVLPGRPGRQPWFPSRLHPRGGGWPWNRVSTTSSSRRYAPISSTSGVPPAPARVPRHGP